ncbi:MAG: glycosyltransferase family 2 protein [Phycisphaerae bacterium]
MPRSGDYSVSVVIAAYNAAEWLGKAVMSALNQTCKPLEVVVVDDGSEDNTAEIACVLGENVRVIQQENAGAGAARNAGIRAAKGDFVAFLDSDDYWLEDKLEKQLAILRANPSLRWCTGNYLIDIDGKPGKAEPDPASDTINFFTSYQARTRGHTCAMLIERGLLLEAGLFGEDITQSEDTELWFKIAFRAPELGYMREPLVVVRSVNEGSLTKGVPDVEIPLKIIARLLAEAKQLGVYEEFRPCAAAIVKWWVILLIYTDQSGDARRLMWWFAPLLTWKYLLRNYFISFFPDFYRHRIRRAVPSLKNKQDMPQVDK